MWFDRLTPRLRRLYASAAPAPKDMSPDAALERRLLQEHARLHPAAPGRGFVSAHRFAFAGVGVALAVAAACQVPVDYERELGASITCDLPRETWPEGQLESVAGGLAESFGAPGVAMRVHDEGGVRSLRLDLWGADVDDAQLITALRSTAPSLPAAACVRTPLTGTVHGTLGGRLGHDLLDIELDRADAEAARRQIREALAREGIDGEADVQVHDHDDGHREVKVHIETHRRETLP